jgi:hypothetical protein
LPASALDACRQGPITLDPGNRTVAAIDASTKYDSTAIKVWDARGEGDGLRVREVSRIWERPIDPRTGRHLEGWRVPLDEVGWHLYSLHYGTAVAGDWCDGGRCRCGCERSFAPLGLEAIGFDPAFITWEASRWEADGLPMLEVPQTNGRMIPGTQGLYKLIVEERFQHEGDADSERHFRSVTAKEMPGGGQRLMKPKGSRKYIDGAIASVMCAYLLLRGEGDQEEAHRASIYVFNAEDGGA